MVISNYTEVQDGLIEFFWKVVFSRCSYIRSLILKSIQSDFFTILSFSLTSLVIVFWPHFNVNKRLFNLAGFKVSNYWSLFRMHYSRAKEFSFSSWLVIRISYSSYRFLDNLKGWLLLQHIATEIKKILIWVPYLKQLHLLLLILFWSLFFYLLLWKNLNGQCFHPKNKFQMKF